MYVMSQMLTFFCECLLYFLENFPIRTQPLIQKIAETWELPVAHDNGYEGRQWVKIAAGSVMERMFYTSSYNQHLKQGTGRVVSQTLDSLTSVTCTCTLMQGHVSSNKSFLSHAGRLLLRSLSCSNGNLPLLDSWLTCPQK